MTGCISVYVTASSAAEAERIGRALVEERLAACANVLPGVVSLYHWEGGLQRDDEVALILKTRRALFDRVAQRVAALHSYAQPCIVAWPIEAGSAGYLSWIEKETQAV